MSEKKSNYSINDRVITPDGKGIIKRIEELYSGKIAPRHF